MRARFALAVVAASVWVMEARGGDQSTRAVPIVADGWTIELAAQAPAVAFPTALVAAADGTVYVGSDPMDATGPPTEPIDRVVAFRNGTASVFAEGLWSVRGLEWVDDTLYVVHPPLVSALRDTDGDGKADSRVDLATGLGPAIPAFDGINDHIASGIRLGMDGYLYIAVGDKGIHRGSGRDGATIQLFGGGVIRIRPGGTGLEVVSTGERNPQALMLSATDEIITYGGRDKSGKWPASLTHHIAGGHYGYPYQFLTAPYRALSVMSRQADGAGGQGVCYTDDRLPAEYRGNLFVCDWGLQTVVRFEIRRVGASFAVARRTTLASRGSMPDFRPMALAVARSGDGFWLTDWANDRFLSGGPAAGRLYRLKYAGGAGGAVSADPSLARRVSIGAGAANAGRADPSLALRASMGAAPRTRGGRILACASG